MIRKLKDKQGISYILTCVIILIAIMLISISFEYAHIYHISRTQKEDVQLKLDSYITETAINNYEALKQGNTYSAKLDKEKICAGALEALGFSTNNTEPYIAYGNEKCEYTMKKPTIEYLYDNCFGVRVTYEIMIPFEIWNRKISDISISVKIVSIYTESY